MAVTGYRSRSCAVCADVYVIAKKVFLSGHSRPARRTFEAIYNFECLLVHNFGKTQTPTKPMAFTIGKYLGDKLFREL